VVDPSHGAADLSLDVAQKDASAAANVEQAITRPEGERLENRLPGERVRVGSAVRLPRGLAVRPASDAIGHPVDPPLADSTEEA
jgi:hypothetical protein